MIRASLASLLMFSARLSSAAEPAQPEMRQDAAAPARASAQPGTSAYLKIPPTSAVSPACVVPKAVGPLVKVPLFGQGSAACPIALVGDSVITVRELTEALAASHERRGEQPGSGGAKRPEMDFMPALDRLIETRLVVAEAHDMGLDALPDVQGQLDAYRASLHKRMLERRATAGIKPDALEVERAYREAVREWKVRSVLFERPDDAKAAQALLASGKKLDDVAQQMIEEKKAKGSGEAEWLSAARMLPEIKAAIDSLAIGAVSELVKVPNGQVLLRVEGVRYPDDPKVKADAQEHSVNRQRRAALKRFYASLTKKYASVDRRLLDKLDWEAPKPGFAALARDRRAVATIRGDKAITVAELTAGIGEKFFHGIEGPIREHRVNLQKMEVFSSMLDARLIATEAAARKLEQTEELRHAVNEQRRGMAFGKFIEKVLIPDLKVTEAEARKYFDEHQRDYA